MIFFLVQVLGVVCLAALIIGITFSVGIGFMIALGYIFGQQTPATDEKQDARQQ